MDGKWADYTHYLQRVIDRVDKQWERLIMDSKTYPPAGSSVAVKFVLNAEGKVVRIVSVENGSSEAGARAAVGAITDNTPYEPWTEAMRAVLGGEQEMTFTFYYQ